MPEITKTQGDFTGTIIVAEHDKLRIHIIGRFGKEGTELQPYEAFLVQGEEWTDGFEFEVSHDLEDDTMDNDEWNEEIEFIVPMILWGENQEYEALITDEHRALVAAL